MNLSLSHKPFVAEVQAWASPAPGWTLADLQTELLRLGHRILCVDDAGQRIQVLHETYDAPKE